MEQGTWFWVWFKEINSGSGSGSGLILGYMDWKLAVKLLVRPLF
jgi:hypothetical protein